MLFGLLIAAICLIAAVLGLLVLPLVVWFSLIALGIFCFVFWIWMLIDSIKNEGISSNERVVWVLVIGLTHIIGAIIYFFVAKNRQPTFLRHETVSGR